MTTTIRRGPEAGTVSFRPTDPEDPREMLGAHVRKSLHARLDTFWRTHRGTYMSRSHAVETAIERFLDAEGA